MPATRPTISIVQLYVRRDQMMANLRSVRSFDASVGLLSPEDRVRYFGEPERVVKTAPRAAVLAAALVAVAACDAAPVGDGFAAPPAPGITSAASTDAPPVELDSTSADDDDTGVGTTGDEPLPDTTTTGADASTSTAALDTTGEPASSTTTDDAGTTTDAGTSGEASTGDDTSTGDDMIGTSTGSTGDDSTTGAADESSTGEPPPVELPPECLDYIPLTEPNRNVSFGIYGPKGCDSPAMAAGWYRLQGAAGTRMPTTPPPIYSAGTHAPGWMDGTHPTVADGIVERIVCYHWVVGVEKTSVPCWASMPLKVRNCNDEFIVYFITPSPSCNTRIAGEDA